GVTVRVHGRVRGLVDIGGDEESGGIDFRSFGSRDGKPKQSIVIRSEESGLKLKIKRKPGFLTVGLKKEKQTDRDGPLVWTLSAAVNPGQVEGTFPRDEPGFEDCAIYLEARVPGQKKVRLIRIPVRGTATAG